MKFEECIENRLTGRHKKCFEFVGGEGGLRNKKILDIGCSFGWFEKYAVDSKCTDIVGLEPKKESFLPAQRDVPEAIFKEGSALKIPFPDNYFDLVVAFDVIEHLPKKKESIALGEIIRVLKNKGQVVLSTPNRNLFSNILDPAWYFGHRHYSSEDIIKLLKEKNIKDIEIEVGGRFYELFGMILLYICKWIFRSEVPFKEWFELKKDKEYLTTKAGFVTLFAKGVVEK